MYIGKILITFKVQSNLCSVFVLFIGLNHAVWSLYRKTNHNFLFFIIFYFFFFNHWKIVLQRKLRMAM
jgi:hypothetical protein